MPSVSQDQVIWTMEECIVDVHAWMHHNMLKLNDSKTEFLIKLSSKSSRSLPKFCQPRLFTILRCGFIRIRMHMLGRSVVKAFFGLCKIRQTREFLSEDATKLLVHAFVTSHINYCNSLLYGVSPYQHNLLQHVLNAARALNVRITSHISRYSHIIPVLFQLHWLPVALWIRFKIVLLVYKHSKAVSILYNA